ncbi:MAG: LacI family DNA-binding transcriptional regulator [Opitutaceae bacterium]
MATIYEVARQAGVSPKTVARILAGEQGRPRNRERVLAAARKLGYVRNQQAANLRSGKSGLLGVIVPDISNPFYPVFFQSIHESAAGYNYQILLSSTFGKISEEVHALRTFEVNRVEGIILNAAEGEADDECNSIIERFINRGVPVVLAGRPARNLPVDEIVIQNTSATERATNYLLKIGHRKIAFITGSASTLASSERRSGFERALKAASIDIKKRWMLYGDFTAESGRQYAHQILTSTNRPTAIVAANDLIALGAIRACHELKLRVPEDVAIIGFDDIAVAQLVTPALTTVRQPQRQIAREVVALLMDRIQSRDLSNPRRLAYELELIIRESA